MKKLINMKKSFIVLGSLLILSFSGLMMVSFTNSNKGIINNQEALSKNIVNSKLIKDDMKFARIINTTPGSWYKIFDFMMKRKKQNKRIYPIGLIANM